MQVQTLVEAQRQKTDDTEDTHSTEEKRMPLLENAPLRGPPVDTGSQKKSAKQTELPLQKKKAQEEKITAALFDAFCLNIRGGNHTKF